MTTRMDDNEHAWQPAANRFTEETLPLLRMRGKDIGISASYGNDLLATEIINHYGLLRRSFDPVNASLLHEKVIEWIRLHPKE